MNKNILNKRYIQIIWLCFFGYMISYIGKLGYTANIQNFIEDYGTTKLIAGYASSAFFLCYGAGQFINAMFCEKVNSIKIVSLSLVISSVFSIALFFIRNMIVITVLWGLNGLIMSTLWCNIVKITTQIKDEKYLKKSIVALSMTVPVGTLITYGLSALLTSLGIWKIYFIISFAVVLGGGVIFYFFTTKASKDVERLYVPNKENSSTDNTEEETREKKSFWKFFAVAIIPLFLIIVFGAVIKDGIQTWMPTFLKENYEMPTYFSILITLILPLVGVFSAILGKWSIYKFKNEFIVGFLIFVISALFVVLFMMLGAYSVAIAIIIFAILSFLTHASNSVFTSVVPIFYKDKIKSGQGAGILNGFAYVGSTLSSFALGGVVDSYGWNVFIYVLLGCAVIAIVSSIWGFFYTRKKIKRLGK